MAFMKSFVDLKICVLLLKCSAALSYECEILSDLLVLSIPAYLAYNLNLSVPGMKIEFVLTLSFSDAVRALVEAWDFPSIARSYLFLEALVTLTSSFV